VREKHRLKVFENRMLKMRFGLKRGEAAGERRTKHNEGLYVLYSYKLLFG
jgi:hypothetical protein